MLKQEVEAATADLNAALSTRLATEKRALIAQLNKEADDIEKRITEVAAMEETGFWECECGKEDTDAPAVPQAQGHFIHYECGKEMKLISRATMSGQEKYESDKDRGIETQDSESGGGERNRKRKDRAILPGTGRERQKFGRQNPRHLKGGIQIHKKS